jgi:hypothetical protein
MMSAQPRDFSSSAIVLASIIESIKPIRGVSDPVTACTAKKGRRGCSGPRSGRPTPGDPLSFKPAQERRQEGAAASPSAPLAVSTL